jgi:hypothetical protein
MMMYTPNKKFILSKNTYHTKNSSKRLPINILHYLANDEGRLGPLVLIFGKSSEFDGKE